MHTWIDNTSEMTPVRPQIMTEFAILEREEPSVNGGAKPRRMAGRSKSAALCWTFCRNRHDSLRSGLISDVGAMILAEESGVYRDMENWVQKAGIG